VVVPSHGWGLRSVTGSLTELGPLGLRVKWFLSSTATPSNSCTIPARTHPPQRNRLLREGTNLWEASQASYVSVGLRQGNHPSDVRKDKHGCKIADVLLPDGRNVNSLFRIATPIAADRLSLERTECPSPQSTPAPNTDAASSEVVEFPFFRSSVLSPPLWPTNCVLHRRARPRMTTSRVTETRLIRRRCTQVTIK
jgi:hypothetical protein